MKTLSVGDFKTNFSEILLQVKGGSEIAIAYGKKKEVVAMIVPYVKPSTKLRKLGLLKGRGSFKIKGDFKMPAEELFSL